MPISGKEREERERFAIDETCKEYKRHYERVGDYKRTGEQIEREVKSQVAQIEREKDHAIYKDK